MMRDQVRFVWVSYTDIRVCMATKTKEFGIVLNGKSGTVVRGNSMLHPPPKIAPQMRILFFRSFHHPFSNFFP